MSLLSTKCHRKWWSRLKRLIRVMNTGSTQCSTQGLLSLIFHRIPSYISNTKRIISLHVMVCRSYIIQRKWKRISGSMRRCRINYSAWTLVLINSQRSLFALIGRLGNKKRAVRFSGQPILDDKFQGCELFWLSLSQLWEWEGRR